MVDEGKALHDAAPVQISAILDGDAIGFFQLALEPILLHLSRGLYQRPDCLWLDEIFEVDESVFVEEFFLFGCQLF